jgi:hypothetical protein
MANLPSLRGANWGAALNEFLQVEHHNDGTHKKDAILGDGTAGRRLRCINLSIDDGIDPNTLKCRIDSVFNGGEIDWENNLAKGSYTANLALDGSGAILTIKTSALAGGSIAVICANIYANASGVTLCVESYTYSSATIRVLLNVGDTAQDLTNLVDTGPIYITIVYLTLN